MKGSPIKTGIVGASGYSGDVLLTLLSRHPGVDLSLLGSRSLDGKEVDEAVPALRGRLPGLIFEALRPEDFAASDAEVIFLALPHGVSAEYALPLLEAGKTVIDLSADFRLGDADLYQSYYGHPHPAPRLLGETPYVIPELEQSDEWMEAPLIACPGCYPTSILTPLVPLLRDGFSYQDIVIHSMSAVSGAGKKSDAAHAFCELNESVKAYGLPRHRHLSEIEEQLSGAAEAETVVRFYPHLVPMQRGICSTISFPDGGRTLEDLYRVWELSFGDAPFVSILPSGQIPETRWVAGTNRVEFSALHDVRTGYFVITSVIDNLMKGASGQAVQIFNLKFGFPETEALY